MKKCMNFKFVVLFALTLLAGSTVYGQDNVIDEVVWVVGDEAILKSEVEEARMSALYEGRKFDRDPYCVIPEEIAVQKLFLHQAALDSIEVSEAEVIQRVDYMTNMYITNIGSREKMEEYFNKTSSPIRETLRDNAPIVLRRAKPAFPRWRVCIRKTAERLSTAAKCRLRDADIWTLLSQTWRSICKTPIKYLRL